METWEDLEDGGGYDSWAKGTYQEIIVQNGWNIKNMGCKVELM